MILEFRCRLCDRLIKVDTQLHERIYGKRHFKHFKINPVHLGLSAHLVNKHRFNFLILDRECIPPQTFELKKVVGEVSGDSKFKRAMKKVFEIVKRVR